MSERNLTGIPGGRAGTPRVHPLLQRLENPEPPVVAAATVGVRSKVFDLAVAAAVRLPERPVSALVEGMRSPSFHAAVVRCAERTPERRHLKRLLAALAARGMPSSGLIRIQRVNHTHQVCEALFAHLSRTWRLDDHGGSVDLTLETLRRRVETDELEGDRVGTLERRLFLHWIRNPYLPYPSQLPRLSLSHTDPELRAAWSEGYPKALSILEGGLYPLETITELRRATDFLKLMGRAGEIPSSLTGHYLWLLERGEDRHAQLILTVFGQWMRRPTFVEWTEMESCRSERGKGRIPSALLLSARPPVPNPAGIHSVRKPAAEE